MSLILWSYPRGRYKQFVSVVINLRCADSVHMFSMGFVSGTNIKIKYKKTQTTSHSYHKIGHYKFVTNSPKSKMIVFTSSEQSYHFGKSRRIHFQISSSYNNAAPSGLMWCCENGSENVLDNLVSFKTYEKSFVLVKLVQIQHGLLSTPSQCTRIKRSKVY